MLRRIALMATLLATLSTLGFAAAAPSHGGGPHAQRFSATADYCLDSEEAAFLTLINNYRAQNGAGPLAAVQTAGAAADHHSIDMATNNYFSHTLFDGTTWSQNLANHGYTNYGGYRGENIAGGYSTALSAFNAWKASSLHNANMLNINFTAIGIGRAYGANAMYGWYWTTTFGGYVDGAAAVCGGSGGGSPTPTPAPTIAPGTVWTIVGSGRSSNSNESTLAYDGNGASAWATTSTRRPSNAYVWFDLGASRSIRKIEWLFAETGFSDSMKIQISNDRSTWATLTTIGNAPVNTWQTYLTNASARYVRFYFSNPNKDPKLGAVGEVRVSS